MFWNYHTSSSSQIDSLFAKEDVTLQEVMDSEDIISECRVQNKTLIDFLLKPEVMEELVTLTTREPSIEIEEKSRFKYPNIASELLTCDVPAINERLAGDERLLEKLYVFLESDPPLNSLLASYFSKIMGALIAKKTEQVLDFLKARDTFLPLLIKHLGTSAIMDLMLKLMTQVEGLEMRQNILNWLDSQRIIQQLVSLLNPQIEKERHDNVAQLLCDFIRIARDHQRNYRERADPDPLLNTLESPDTVQLLLDQMLDKEKCESSIVGGIQVLLVLLDVNQTSFPCFRSAASIASSMYNSNINDEALDMEQKQRIVFNTTDAICDRLKDFHGLLLEPPKKSSIITSVGLLDPPLGNTRLQVVRLLAALIPSNHPRLYSELITLNTIPVVLELFFKYSWNNFLHTQVENCLVNLLKVCTSGDMGETVVNSLYGHLLDNCNLIEKIITAWKDNDEKQAEGKNIRQGYMGHLISILNKLVEISSSSPLGQQLKDLKPETSKQLDEFKESVLAEANRVQNSLLAGVHPNSLLEDNDDFGDAGFAPSNPLLQQIFSQYQMQNLSSQCIDGYSGFNDDAFNDGDDTLQTIDNPSDVNFDLSESEMVQRDEIFKQVCAQSINTLFDADEQTFEEKDHTFQTVIEKQGDKSNDAVYSSDSDDEGASGEDNMDVDPWTSPRSDPWGTSTASSSNEVGISTGWADFSSATFVNSSNFGIFPDSEPKEKKEEAQSCIEDKDDKQGSDEQVDAKDDDQKKIKSAASGDHIEQRETGVDSSSEQQPSMSIEGDTCKPPEKSQNPSENSKIDQSKKV